MLGNFFVNFFSQSFGPVWVAFFCGLIFGGVAVFWALFEKKEVEEAEDVADKIEKEMHASEHPTYNNEVL